MTTHYRSAWQSAGAEAWVYLRLSRKALVSDAELAQWSASLQSAIANPAAAEALSINSIRLSRLELVFEATGASGRAAPHFHYVVEMDPDDGWMDELARWYNTEHMPGLAAVPGCVCALRMLNHDHQRHAQPYSLACYDLEREDTLGSPAWLAVRGTAWSDICRPHFLNTRRTMTVVCG